MKKIFLIFTIFIFLPTVVSAQRYLVNLPIDNTNDMGEYINLLYKMSISIAALLAVAKIIIAGGKYMLSDVVTNKSDAKSDIKGALLGLLLILSAVVILETINPALREGGLNITPIVVPELDISNPSVRTVDGESSGDVATALELGLPTCANVIDLGISVSGNYTLSRLIVDDCTDPEKEAALSTFSSSCTSNGGALNGTNIYECKKELASHRYAYIESWPVTSYVASIASSPFYDPTSLIRSYDVPLSREFFSLNGQVATYDAEGFCQKMNDDGMLDFFVSISDCRDEVQEVYISAGLTKNAYCENNGGRPYPNAPQGTFACELPRMAIRYREAEELYREQYNENSSFDLDYENYQKICTDTIGGRLQDTARLGDMATSDYLCVVY